MSRSYIRGSRPFRRFSVATSQAISMPNLTILSTGMAFLITLLDILICDEVVGTEKCNNLRSLYS